MRNLDMKLGERVFAQPEAITAVAKAIKRNRSGFGNPNKPVGSFIFLGPTGVGKTELAKTLADIVMHNPNALIRFDMSEYMEKHSVSKLIGSPPGYVGHEEGGQLTEKVKHNPYSVVLLDEIEKAHPELLNVLLQVFEDGHLTDGLGNKINFKNTIVIMTSNIGTKIEPGKEMGFAASATKEQRELQERKKLILAEIRRHMSPEFRNRLDGILFFNPLPKSEIRNIARKFLIAAGKIMEEKGLQLNPDRDVTEAAYDYMVRHGHDIDMGARPMDRLIQNEVTDVIVDKSYEEEDLSGTRVKIDVENPETDQEKLSIQFEKASAPAAGNDNTSAAAPSVSARRAGISPGPK
jgi:ATP-dependent Clp protease ATP-binding subunit ClpC